MGSSSRAKRPGSEAIFAYMGTPQPGEYIVRVRARNVVEDARVDTPALDQDFALVVSGALPLPGIGVLFFDRGAYRAPDVIRVKLIDPDLAGQPSIDVRITSSTETNGEALRLTASGSLGVFTNNIAVPPLNNRRHARQVAHIWNWDRKFHFRRSLMSCFLASSRKMSSIRKR